MVGMPSMSVWHIKFHLGSHEQFVDCHVFCCLLLRRPRALLLAAQAPPSALALAHVGRSWLWMDVCPRSCLMKPRRGHSHHCGCQLLASGYVVALSILFVSFFWLSWQAPNHFTNPHETKQFSACHRLAESLVPIQVGLWQLKLRGIVCRHYAKSGCQF